jgi:hypothetical protein
MSILLNERAVREQLRPPLRRECAALYCRWAKVENSLRTSEYYKPVGREGATSNEPFDFTYQMRHGITGSTASERSQEIRTKDRNAGSSPETLPCPPDLTQGDATHWRRYWSVDTAR